MNTPDGWLERLVEDLNRTPPGGWVAVVARHADPGRLADVLETTALLAADKAASDAPPGAAAWRAVLRDLEAAHPDHAALVRECGDIPGAIANDRVPDAPTGAHALRPGDRLGPFVVRDYVAGGGMGEVYQAAQDDLDRTVALKVIRAGASGPLARARFHRERLVLARLHQSNIVPVYFAGKDGDLLYYAMQYVPGAPLSRVVTAVFQRASTARKSAQTPPLAEVVGSILTPPPAPAPSEKTQVATQSGPATRFAAAPTVPVRLSAGYFRSAATALAQVAEAIQHGHDTGFLHRDIKPSNLILDARGVCMVIDYGLARACGAAPLGPPNDPVESVLTHGGVGTPQYMAPEQFTGKADARSDVWGLGATLYELLTLRPAFAAGTWSDVQARVRHETPRPPAALVPTVPTDLVAICAKALAKDAADRYQSAGEFAADLRRWLRWEPTRVRPSWGTLRPLRLWAKRHKGAAAAALLAVAALLASAAAVTADARADKAEADANTAVATAQAEAATAQAAEERKAREFAAALAAAEDVRRQRPYAGWSGALRDKLDAARKIRPDAPLTDAYAATLTGPDARRFYQYAHPEGRGPTRAGFAAVAFGPDGRLACGGFGATRGAVFDLKREGNPTFTTRAGGGPVAWAGDTPLQLMPAPDGPALVVWNLAANRVVAELPVPPGPIQGFALALAADGRRAALSLTRPPDKDGKETGVTIAWAVDPKAAGGAAAEVGRWDRPATALAFSPDGRFLAAADDRTVTVRDVATKAEVAAVPAGRLRVASLAFGRNFRSDATGRPAAGPLGEHLLAVGAGGGAVVWDLGTKEWVSSCRGASNKVNALAFTPDGASLITAGHFAPIVWDVATGQAVFELTIGSADPGDPQVVGAAVSPDGRRVAIASTNQLDTAARLQVYEFEADRGVGVLRGLNGMCQQTWLSPSAGLVAGLSDNWQLAVWERESGRLRRVWDVPQGWEPDNADVGFDEPAGLVYFAAGKAACQLNLATGARDRLWPLPLGLNDDFIVRPGRPPVLIRREVPAPDAANRRMTLRGRELLPDGTTRDTFPGYQPAHDYRAVMLTGGGRYLLVSYVGKKPDDAPWFLDAATGRPVVVRPPPGVVVGIDRVSSDGTRLFTDGSVNGGPRGLLQFRFPEMTLLRSDPGFPAYGMQTDDAGKTAITFAWSSGQQGVFVGRVGESRPAAVLDPGHMPLALRLSPDGRFACWGREDGSARVADLPRALERLAALRGR